MIDSRDPLQFTELHRRHEASVRRVASAVLRDAADVDDVVQDTFLRAYVALRRRPIPAEQLRPWLTTIARNRSLDVLRARRRTQLLEDRPDLRALEPGAAHAQREQLLATVTAIRRLPHAQRRALVRHAIDGECYAQIAEELETTSSAAKSLTSRARRRLRRDVRDAAA